MPKPPITVTELFTRLQSHGVRVVLEFSGEIGFILADQPTKLATKLPAKTKPIIRRVELRKHEVVAHTA